MYAILFVDGTRNVIKGVLVLACGKQNWYFVLYMTSSPRDAIAIAIAGIDASLWYRKLGHMSGKWMKMFVPKGIIP